MSIVIYRLRGSKWLFVVAAMVVLIDQITKLLVRIYIPLGNSVPEEGFFRLTYVTNTGGLWSLFQGYMTLLIIMSFVGMAAVLLCYIYFGYRWHLVTVALGLILGGSIGNQIDRLWLGEVTDFIDWGAWPVFNIADSAGVIGVAIIVIFLLFLYREKKDSDTQA